MLGVLTLVSLQFNEIVIALEGEESKLIVLAFFVLCWV